MSQLSVTFLDNKNNEHILNYLIYDTHLAEKWIDITKQNLKNKDYKIKSSLNNFSNEHLALIFNNLRAITEKINTVKGTQLPIYDSYDSGKLNYLHEEFENYGKIIGTDSLEDRQLYFSLNEEIHRCEAVLSNLQHPWPTFSALYDIEPIGMHRDILEEDKLYLVNSHKWGNLYLGYNTLGKNWVDVAMNNDIDVILRDAVKPQERFSAETWLYFGRDMGQITGMKVFYDWVKTLPAELKNRIPFDNLNRLVLGKFLIGEIIIDDKFLNFHNVKSNWYSSSHGCKLVWTKKVFSTFKTIVDISITDKE